MMQFGRCSAHRRARPNQAIALGGTARITAPRISGKRLAGKGTCALSRFFTIPRLLAFVVAHEGVFSRAHSRPMI